HGWKPSLRWAPGASGAFDLWCSPPDVPAPHVCPAVPGRKAERPDRQRAFPPRVELSWKEEVLSGLRLDLPPGRVLRDLLFVTELPSQ
ncbi:hypothetical protein, partial [Streptomyces griseoruber]|uniref:hypothetical protein n=1 Tax=Streptomyces griseoruber TaxID=1943 RepID=UPI0006E1D7FC